MTVLGNPEVLYHCDSPSGHVEYEPISYPISIGIPLFAWVFLRVKFYHFMVADG